MNLKLLIILLSLYGMYYAVNRYASLKNALEYSRAHPSPTLSPKIDYYAGRIYYQADYSFEAEEAFTQLLTGYPTCQYAPSALLYLSFAASNNRHWGVAREALTRYTEEFEKEPDIQLVRKNLEMLNYHHPPGR